MFPFIGDAIRPLKTEGLSNTEKNTLNRFITTDAGFLVRSFPSKCESIPLERYVQRQPSVNVGQFIHPVDMNVILENVKMARDVMKDAIMMFFAYIPAKAVSVETIFNDLFSEENLKKSYEEISEMITRIFESADYSFDDFRDYVRAASTKWFVNYDVDDRFRRLFEFIYTFIATSGDGIEIVEKREDVEEIADASQIAAAYALIARLSSLTNVELGELGKLYDRFSEGIKRVFRDELGKRRATVEGFDPWDYLPDD